MAEFVHLHTHSEFSLLDGLSRIDDLVHKAKDLGMSSIALTDHGAMYGSFRFYLKAQEAGIKPIIGCEIYHAKNSRFDKQQKLGSDQYHLVVLARNLTGYRNLMTIVSKAHLEGFHYKPRADIELLTEYKEGLIVLSGCLQGIVSKHIMQEEPQEAEKWVQKFLQIFGPEHYYLELQRHPNLPILDTVNKELIRLSRKYGIGLVATNDSHYIEKDDAYAHEVLLCIQTRTSMLETNRPMSMIDVPDFYIKSPEEMAALYADIPEAIENTAKIAKLCNLEIPLGQWILPKFPVPENETVETWLKKLTYSRIPNRFEQTNEEILKRIDYEISIIQKKGYAAYFLIVQDFVNWAKDHGIAVGPGRGSAAGSIVSYILGITELNPLLYNLPFERFLNPDRPTPPDIDIDFADERRDEVLRYVTDRYGEDKVAQIITFGTMEARMALRDVARALGWSYSQGDRIAKLIPPSKQGFPVTLDSALEQTPELSQMYRENDKVRELFDVAKKLEGVARHASVHAAGVVIADKPITFYAPIQKEARAGKIITQYDMYCLDMNAVSDGRAVGLMKMDFLGLRNLTILEKALGFVKIRGTSLTLQEIPLDDKKTYSLIAQGFTVGVFQLESRGMRSLAQDLKPNRFSDISAMVALFRPGPMALIPQFIEGKKDPKKITYLHNDLKPTLAETYGILVYQEQVTELAHRIAGFTLTEADSLRMAMGKKKKELMKRARVKFIAGCEKNGYKKSLAVKLYDFIEKFAAYGFNKAHSASYATIAYWTAYVKAHFPVEFMTALVTSEMTGSSGPLRDQKITQALNECKRMAIDVLPPDINRSISGFSIEEKAIRFGLNAIKNVGSAAIDTITGSREKDGIFMSFSDFLHRVDLRRVNKKTVESLIKAGCFTMFGNKAQLLMYYELNIKTIQQQKSKQEEGQFGLFGEATGSSKQIVDKLPDIADISEERALLYEREVLGFNVSINILEKYKPIITKKATCTIGEVTPTMGVIILGGVVKQVKFHATKRDNAQMAFVTITDYISEIELVIFPTVFKKTSELWKLDEVLLIKGKVQDKDGRGVVLVDKAIGLKRYVR
ncbi:MAG: DNA polymerase III subunit alpha [Candidatus Roizmanbacteria bacterium]|nr:DNA polymerase III subunit alpha [Candidatus Roizmanbacteria bacterium]